VFKHLVRALPPTPSPRFNDHLLQLFTSSLFLAAAVAAMIGSWTCNRFGRKMTMLAGGTCFLIGTALVTGAVATGMLVVGRIVLGFGVGFACQVRAASCRPVPRCGTQSRARAANGLVVRSHGLR
jgi:MFS family permease